MAGLSRGRHGVAAAATAAVLFGAGAPAAKALLADASPWLMAGLLYTASGVALWCYRLLRRSPRVVLSPHDRLAVAGAVLCGGVIGPVLLMMGLASMPASGASLLLNAESVFTALIAWIVFKEATNRRVVLGFIAIAAGALVLSWPGDASFAGVLPSLAVLGACLAWGIDNNLTGRVSLTDATWLAMVKGIVAGPINLVLALLLGSVIPSWNIVAAAGVVGVFAYGVSLVLFIVGMRHLGTARAGAYFSVAPFIGALLAVLVGGEEVTVQLVVAGVLMGAGIWLHVTETHSHAHTHEALAHSHTHVHDEHHQHAHEPGVVVVPGKPHTHFHVHEQLTHEHAHYPDAHHSHHH